MNTVFQQWKDKAIIDEHRGSKTFMGKLIAALEEFPGLEIVPTTFWSSNDGDTIDGKAYEQMKHDTLERVAKAMQMSGHGQKGTVADITILDLLGHQGLCSFCPTQCGN